MDGLFQEMLGASNVDIDTNVDIVFAIDATESMQPLIDKVKSLTLSFREELEKGLKENRRIIKNLRIKVIVFRDYYVDDKYAMEESRFFILPEEKQEFYNFVSKIKAGGGGDEPESGLEALALALRSDFVKDGDKNWVCESCGYENEYNDESQPTECLCCGEPASEHQLNQAKQELEKYHKEQARQRRLEQLRQEAIKQQEKIEHSIDAFVKGIKGIAAACIVAMILAVAIAGLNVCQGNITLKYIGTNIKNISVVDNMTDVTDNVSEHLRENTLEYKNNIVRNVSFTTKSKDHSVLAHLELLMENKNEAMKSTSGMFKQIGSDFKGGYENRTKNLAISKNNVANGFRNFTNNCKLFWRQAAKNINQLIDYIARKTGRKK